MVAIARCIALTWRTPIDQSMWWAFSRSMSFQDQNAESARTVVLPVAQT